MPQSREKVELHNNYRCRSKQEIIQWVADSEFSVFGSLLFHKDATVNVERRFKLLRLYWNKLDRVFWGNNASRSGLRVQRHVALHYGTSGANLHAHFVAQPVGDCQLFCKVARQLWCDLAVETIGIKETQIELAKDPVGAAAYLFHERDGWKNYCAELSYKTNIQTKPLELDDATKMRIRKALYGSLN